MDREIWLTVVATLGDRANIEIGREAHGEREAEFRIDRLMDGAHYTTSLDAALTLVPEGWWIASLGQNRHGLLTTVTLYNDEIAFADCKSAKSPALALCAAALRARAAQESGK